MEMCLCEVLTPLNRDGKRHPAGSSVELPVKDAEVLARIRAVKILELVPAQSELTVDPVSDPVQGELTVDPASEVAGVLEEADEIVEGELIGGSEDSDQSSEQEPDQGKKRGGGKK